MQGPAFFLLVVQPVVMGDSGSKRRLMSGYSACVEKPSLGLISHDFQNEVQELPPKQMATFEELSSYPSLTQVCYFAKLG